MKRILQFYILFVLLISACEKKEAAPGMGSWTKKNNFAGEGRANGIALSIGKKGYVGLGNNETSIAFNDFWEYTPETDTWAKKANFPKLMLGGEAICSFAMGNKGYVLAYSSDFFQYDPLTDVWSRKASFPGGIRPGIAGFAIGAKGYVGTGNDHTLKLFNDFWEYDPASDAWTRKADFPGVARTSTTNFAIGNKGYVGLGYDGSGRMESFHTDFWEYDPAVNKWTQKADFTGAKNMAKFSFANTSKGYVVCSQDFSPSNRGDVWEFNPVANNWRRVQFFPSGNNINCQSFTLGNTSYVVGGVYATYTDNVWEYKP
jgi:N-acetylneuraminic acid mutarotase